MASQSVELTVTESTELLPLEHSTSIVWKYFGFPSKDGKITETDKKKRRRVYCKLCRRDYSYVGNTSNIWQHLEESHIDKAKEECKDTSASQSSKRKEELESSMHSTLTEMFQAKNPYPRNSTRWKTLTEAVCLFIAKDMHPYQTVNDSGFQHMLHTFDQRYHPPDRKTVSTKLIPKLYDDERKRVCHALTSEGSFSLTTDIWTSRHNQAYTGLTVHYVDDSFNLKSHLLEAVEFPESHTGVNISEELVNILDDWELSQDNLSAVTTDNGTNIVLAMELLQWSRVPCFSHTLQLAVEVVLKLPEVSRALARCRQLVGHFNRSAKSNYLLKQKQTDLRHKQLALIQDVSTRWNSAYYMVERILSQQQPLCATLLELHKGDMMPSDAEFSTLEIFVKVMKPLVEITEDIGAEKWVTISVVRLVIHKLLETYLKPTPGDARLEKTMKEAMHSNFCHRYTGSVLMLLNKTAFLDARFKALPFLSDEERQNLLSSIEAETVKLALNSATSSTGTPMEVEEVEEDELPLSKRCRVSKAEKRLLNFVDDIVKVNKSSQSPAEKARAEVRRYTEEEPSAERPLEWWKINHTRYPYLSSLAKKYLAIPATSVPAERAFSIAGHIVNQKRSCLLPENVNKLVFLAENLKL